MINIFKHFKRKAPEWKDIPLDTQKAITRRLVGTVKNMVGARYKLVSGTDEWQRERGAREYREEDQILASGDRAKLLNLARNAYRNNPQLVTVLRQFDLQAIGTVGGKAILTFDDRDFAKTVKEAFASWTRSADFHFGLNLNGLLKIILKTSIIGGDLVLVFDDDLITDSGRVILFEPDEIGNCSEEALERHYGKNATQSLGIVRNQYSQFIGAVVSKSQRGMEVFEEDKSYFLWRDPNGNQMDDLWMMPRNVFRISQGRGITPLASRLSTLIDVCDYVGYELAAAKKNSQTIAQITQSEQEQAELPSAFDDSVDFSSMTDKEIEEAAKAEIDIQEKTVTLDRINAAGVIYQVMPEGSRMELLETRHPNINSAEFVRWLASFSAAPFGLTSQYATLKVDSSYSGFKGEQQMCAPAFEEAQHYLEQICDWLIFRWSKWAVRKGIIPDKFDEGWLRGVSWMWPRQKDLDDQKEQSAIKLRLQNQTGSYRDLLGPDWRERLLQISEEVKFCNDHGLVHPSQTTVSGGVVNMDEVSTTKEGEE